MPLLPSYPLDLTNSALSNRITDEIHTFNVLTDRMFVPSAGPFYTQGFDIRHPVTNAPLLPNVHYKILHLHKEASLQSGKNVCCIVYVHNASIPGCKINYQVVGGVYSDTADVIREILDNLPNLPNANQVHWGQIIGQPVQYPPAAHRHHVDSLYNMGDVVNVLEQIRTSMLAGDAGAFEAIYQYIFNLFGNAAFVTGSQLNDEISARSSADTRIHSIIQNVSKLNGYAIAAVLSKLLDQTLGESNGFIGDITHDGLNVEIAQHATLVETTNYSDADGLSTSIPIIGVSLLEKVFTASAPTNALDEYNRYMLYARVVPRIDSPDTVYHPDTISNIDEYNSIGEIEYAFDGPYNAATVGDITTDQATRTAGGFILIRSVITPYGAIATNEYAATIKAIDKGHLLNRFIQLQQYVNDVVAVDRSVLSTIVANTNNANAEAYRGFGNFGVVNVTSPGACSLYIAKGTVLYNDDILTPTDNPTITAIQQTLRSFTLTRPVSGYGQYLIFARPVNSLEVSDIEYVVKGPFLTANPHPNLTSIYGAGYEFADNGEFVAWRDGGGWKLMLGVSLHTGADISIRSVTQHGMGNMLGDSPIKMYGNLSDLTLECEPSALAYVARNNSLFKWVAGSYSAETTDTDATVMVVAPNAAYDGASLSSGRFISIYRDNQALLKNNAITVDVGVNSLATSTDLNTVATQGRYSLAGVYVNAPPDVTAGILEVKIIDNLNAYQKMEATNADDWIRVKLAGVWSAWRKYVKDDALNPITETLSGLGSLLVIGVTAKGRRCRIYAISPGGGGGGGGGGGSGTGGSGDGAGGGGQGGSSGRRVVIELDNLQIGEIITFTINAPGQGGAGGAGAGGAGGGVTGSSGTDAGPVSVAGYGWTIIVPGGKGGNGGYGGFDGSSTPGVAAPAVAGSVTLNGLQVTQDLREFNFNGVNVVTCPGVATVPAVTSAFNSEYGQAGNAGAGTYFMDTTPGVGGTPGAVATDQSVPGNDALSDAPYGTGGCGGGGGSHGTGGTAGGDGSDGGVGRLVIVWFAT